MRHFKLGLAFAVICTASMHANAYDADLFHQLLRSGEPALALALIDSPTERAKKRRRIDFLRMARALDATGQCSLALDALRQARELATDTTKDPQYALNIERRCLAVQIPVAPLDTKSVEIEIPPEPSSVSVSAEPLPLPEAVAPTTARVISGLAPASRASAATSLEVPERISLSDTSKWSLVGILFVIASVGGILMNRYWRGQVRDLARNEVSGHLFHTLDTFPVSAEYEDPVLSFARESALSQSGIS